MTMDFITILTERALTNHSRILHGEIKSTTGVSASAQVKELKYILNKYNLFSE